MEEEAKEGTNEAEATLDRNFFIGNAPYFLFFVLYFLLFFILENLILLLSLNPNRKLVRLSYYIFTMLK
jgi:hypothetical protein